MHRFVLGLCLAAGIGAFCAGAAYAADPAAPSVSKTYNQQLTNVEKEFVSLVEAMPEDKFAFAPKEGEFKGVRTFGQQASHVAFVNYSVAAAILGEANPTTSDDKENGPATLKSKQDVVKYVKDSFAYTHKAMSALTEANLMELVKSAFGDNKTTRLNMANVALWHSFDHYGQMVVYARMNSVVPPASRQ